MKRRDKRGHDKGARKAGQTTAASEAEQAVEQAVNKALALAVEEYQAARFPNVERICVQVLQSLPHQPMALHLLGAVNLQKGHYEEAETFVARSVAADPDVAAAHNTQGIIEAKLNQHAAALASFQRALALSPDLVDGHANLGNVYKDVGRMDDALACYREALRLDPTFVQARNSLLFSLYHCDDVTPDVLFAEHREYNRVHAQPIAAPPLVKPMDADKKPLTVGLLGNERLLRSHPVMLLTLLGLEGLDPTSVRLRVYTDGAVVQPDRYTERLQKIAPEWCDIAGISDAAAAEKIRADGVDVLVFLSGHTECRLLIAAHRAAPVQVLWGGHWGTSGLDAMDWIIGDAPQIPEGFEKWYAEKVYRMLDGVGVYLPPDMAPAIGPLPLKDNGVVTFGSLNRSVKLTSATLDLWGRVMAAVPDARLLLRDKHFSHTERVAELTEQFAARGVSADRLIFEGGASHAEFLETYNRIDIALDTQPYSGGLTTCEAMWMGVPVLTLPGHTYTACHSASHLANVGLGEWIAETADDFVAKAADWATRSGDLETLRATLRERMAASPLCDGPRFAGNLEAAFRHMWRKA